MKHLPAGRPALLKPAAAAVACLWGMLAAQDQPAAPADPAPVADPAPEDPTDPADPAAAKLDKLRTAAQAFVDAYNKGDAAALASQFLPDGEISLVTGEVLAGRQAIEEFYRERFAGDQKPQGALEAGAVRFVTPAIAIEDGTFHVTESSGEVVSQNYIAVQVQQDDGSWLTASIRAELEDVAPPSEKLLALEWIVGDWAIQKDGSTTYLAFDWSQDGPYIDGKAVSEKSGVESTATTYRIGWDARRKGFVSWAFDALGGFTYADWTQAGEGAWLLRTRGVTADGEGNQGTQVLEVDPSKQFFTWTMRDQTLGEELQPDRTVKVVQRPPAPKSAATEPTDPAQSKDAAE